MGWIGMRTTETTRLSRLVYWYILITSCYWQHHAIVGGIPQSQYQKTCIVPSSNQGRTVDINDSLSVAVNVKQWHCYFEEKCSILCCVVFSSSININMSWVKQLSIRVCLQFYTTGKQRAGKDSLLVQYHTM